MSLTSEKACLDLDCNVFPDKIAGQADFILPSWYGSSFRLGR